MTEPDYPKFHIANNLKIEETEYINNQLVPVLQFNISVSKEALQDHYVLWKTYFEEYQKFKSYAEYPTPDVEVKKQIIRAFVDKFDNYLWKKMFKEEEQ